MPRPDPRPAGRRTPRPTPVLELVDDLRADRDAYRRVAYILARHLRQSDRMAAAAWRTKMDDVLLELRKLDPERFAREVT